MKGRIILPADVFNAQGDCPVRFLGSTLNASIVPARLARIAGVPLLVVVPKLSGRSISFLVGPGIMPQQNLKGDKQAIKHILAFFEAEIEKDPSVWSCYMKQELK
jgi:lauroyl/myristoyl acyltransferase